MKKSLSILVALLVAAATITPLAALSLVSAGSSDDLFESEGMRGVTTDFLGSAGTIRTIPGPGAPWVIDEGEVRIDADGRLRVEVEGLVLDPATVPPPLGGTNPAGITHFRAIVSCLSVDQSGSPTVINVETDVNGDLLVMPTGVEGDAELDAMISLPDPCFGIIVFVTAPFGAWFAATGF